MPIKTNSSADLRDHLAEERAFFTRIRTGIALMGLGFVLAHVEKCGEPTRD
jgi:putative membrane protein